MFLRLWEYFMKPEAFSIKGELSYAKLRNDTLEAIARLPEKHPHRERLHEKILELYPEKPKVVSLYKERLQQLNRRVHRMLDG